MGYIARREDRPKPWMARYKGPDGRHHSKAFRRKVDAERWLREQESSADRGAWIDPSAGLVTFGDWADRWLAGADLKPSTRANYESNLRSRVLPTFGGLAVAKITPAHVRRWQADLRDSGLSPASVRQARATLQAALEVATVDGLIAQNPVERTKPPKVPKRRQLFLDAGQLAALAEAAESRQDGAGALITLLGYSGLRWGEAAALRWENVDLPNRRVRVREAVTDVGGHLEWGTPKTHESRTVVIPRLVADRLGSPGEGLVFTAPRGGTLRVSNFRRAVWLPACEASGMPAGLLVHDLRDTAASLAISAGASIKAVQRMLGHASAAMTLDTYGSLFDEDLEDLADRLDERYGTNDGDNVVRLPRS